MAMSNTRRPSENVLRLRGDLDGRQLSVVLTPGKLTVGSLPANDIVLPVAKVSRHHAVIRVTDERIEVEDLGSTNGTSINGVRVTRGRLGHNDWVQFGPVLLVLEAVAAADTEVAIPLDSADTPDDRSDGRAEVSTDLVRGEVGTGARWLGFASTLCHHLLGAPTPHLREAIFAVADAFGAEAAAMLQWRAEEPASVRALSGPADLVGAWHGQELQKLTHGDEAEITIVRKQGEVPRLLAVWPRPDDRGEALVLAGRDLIGRPAEVLEPVLRLLVGVAARPLSARSTPGLGATDDRVFPERHVVGSAPATRLLYNQIRGLLPGSTPVLVTGETGVGKEHVVRILHASSDRARGPLEVLNCAAIPADLLEAELFGIEAAVATGVSRRDGKFQLADAGMLFFDEVADMAPGLQAKLLRALQEGEVHPVGARQPIRVDVRIVAATNTDIEERMRSGAFRRDLFYRIAGCEIHVPPLRERREDIPGLVQHFLSTFAEEANRSILGVTLRALEVLQAAAWPGNVRELEHEMRRLVSVCPEGGTIESTMIAPRVADGYDADGRPGPDLGLKDRVADLERQLIADAVDRSEGNLAEAARLLGITRNARRASACPTASAVGRAVGAGSSMRPTRASSQRGQSAHRRRSRRGRRYWRWMSVSTAVSPASGTSPARHR